MTTMTHNQLAWRQFSTHHIRSELGTDDNKHDDARGDDDIRTERFDLTVLDTSKATTHRQSAQSKKRVQWSPKPPTTTVPIAATVETTVALVEKPKKAKTRAARRAEDPEFKSEVEEEPAARKEMRSNYWVRRDDIRRDDARTMKNQFQEIQE